MVRRYSVVGGEKLVSRPSKGEEGTGVRLRAKKILRKKESNRENIREELTTQSLNAQGKKHSHHVVDPKKDTSRVWLSEAKKPPLLRKKKVGSRGHQQKKKVVDTLKSEVSPKTPRRAGQKAHEEETTPPAKQTTVFFSRESQHRGGKRTLRSSWGKDSAEKKATMTRRLAMGEIWGKRQENVVSSRGGRGGRQKCPDKTA